jgi:hypothetical protein
MWVRVFLLFVDPAATKLQQLSFLKIPPDNLSHLINKPNSAKMVKD